MSSTNSIAGLFRFFSKTSTGLHFTLILNQKPKIKPYLQFRHTKRDLFLIFSLQVNKFASISVVKPTSTH